MVNELAQRAGLVLTECQELCQDKFQHYQSTGFRNQSKSFHTKSGLVHRFEPSLPIEHNIHQFYDQLNTRLFENELNETVNRFVHPFVEFKHQLGNRLAKLLDVRLVLDDPNKNLETLTCFSVFKLSDQVCSEIDESIIEIKYFDYELNLVLSTKQVNKIDQFKSILASMLHGLVHIEDNQDAAVCRIDLVELFVKVFNLSDRRLLFTNDKRNYVRNETISINEIKPSLALRQNVVETSKWTHDLSFWCNETTNHEFDLQSFLTTIRDSCGQMIRHVKLLDRYKCEKTNRLAYCWRFFYESCDRALSWTDSTQIQYFIRDELTSRNNLILR